MPACSCGPALQTSSPCSSNAADASAGTVRSTGSHVCASGATVSVKWDDFVALAEGRLDPMMAFMQGKLKIAGDMMIAQKLAPLLKG